MNIASNGKYYTNELPCLTICKDAADYAAKVQDWEDEGEPNTVFLVPGTPGLKIARSEEEIIM